MSVSRTFVSVAPNHFTPRSPLLITQHVDSHITTLKIAYSVNINYGGAITGVTDRQSGPFKLAVIHPKARRHFLTTLPMSTVDNVKHSTRRQLHHVHVCALNRLSHTPRSALTSVFNIGNRHVHRHTLKLRVSRIADLSRRHGVGSIDGRHAFTGSLARHKSVRTTVTLLNRSIKHHLHHRKLANTAIALGLGCSCNDKHATRHQLPRPASSRGVFITITLRLLSGV